MNEYKREEEARCKPTRRDREGRREKEGKEGEEREGGGKVREREE